MLKSVSLGTLLWTLSYVITTVTTSGDRTRNRSFSGNITRNRIEEWVTSDISSDDNNTVDERPSESANVYHVSVEYVDYLNQESIYPNANDGFGNIAPSNRLMNLLSAQALAHNYTLTRFMNTCGHYTVWTDGRSSEMNLARFHGSPHSVFVKKTSEENYIIYIPRNPPTSPEKLESDEYYTAYDTTPSSPLSPPASSAVTWPTRQNRFPWPSRTWP